MPEYLVTRYETWTTVVRVTADSPARAIAEVLSGGGEEKPGSAEYLEINEDVGLSVETCDDGMTEELVSLGHSYDTHIPAIRAIALSDEPAAAATGDV